MSKLIVQTVAVIGLGCAMAAPANANLPTEVSEAYQTYEIALNGQQFEAAETAAYLAWQNAETELGDSKVTGDLAQNYADILAYNEKSFSKAKKAYRRAIELAAFYPEDTALTTRLDRTVSLSTYAQAKGRLKHTKRDLDKAIKAAETAKAEANTFLAEIYTLRAGTVSLSRNAKEARAYGQLAEAMFAAADDDIASPYKEAASEYAELCINRYREYNSGQSPTPFNNRMRSVSITQSK